MALTNQSKNTGSLTNKQFGSKSAKWQDQNYNWNQAQGTWNNPYGFSNQTKNSGSITNQAKNLG